MHALAQHALEILSLRHRTVEQVLPALRPLLEAGGTLTGHGGQLLVRASAANLAELKQALAAIDRPLRRLQISVRFDDAEQAGSQGVAAEGRVGNRGARVAIRAHDNQTSGAERVDQRIEVLEGSRARIMTGQATPLPGGTWETGSGFEATAQLSGDTVLLEIAPQKATMDRQQGIATTVSARLGEWVEVGSAASSGAHEHGGIASRTRSQASERRRVWLKVEERR